MGGTKRGNVDRCVALPPLTIAVIRWLISYAPPLPCETIASAHLRHEEGGSEQGEDGGVFKMMSLARVKVSLDSSCAQLSLMGRIAFRHRDNWPTP